MGSVFLFVSFKERNIFLSLNLRRNLSSFETASRWDPANTGCCHLGNVMHSQFVFNLLPLQERILDFRA